VCLFVCLFVWDSIPSTFNPKLRTWLLLFGPLPQHHEAGTDAWPAAGEVLLLAVQGVRLSHSLHQILHHSFPPQSATASMGQQKTTPSTVRTHSLSRTNGHIKQATTPPWGDTTLSGSSTCPRCTPRRLCCQQQLIHLTHKLLLPYTCTCCCCWRCACCCFASC
jgi:hypothetical protein